MIFTTPFAGNSHKAYTDFYVHTQHESAFKVEINAGGTALRLSMHIPTIVTSSDRLTRELTIAGNHDSIMSGHTETVDAIIAEHGTGEIWTEEQEIILPFSCDKEFNKCLIWHDGDTQFYADFSTDPQIEGAWHQMCPILRVELTSSSKKVTHVWAGKTMAVMPGGMSSPAGGAAPHGGEDEKMSEDDDDDKKTTAACPVTPPAHPPSQVFALDPNDTRLRSSGGPGNAFVSGGLLAESMCREARAASRRGEEESDREHVANGDKKDDDDVSL
jgi:hypothetical protein